MEKDDIGGLIVGIVILALILAQTGQLIYLLFNW